MTNRNRKIGRPIRPPMEFQLAQAMKMEAMGQLTGGLAHDFNNLLGIILGNLDFLEAKLAPGTDESNLAQAAIKAAVQGAELTRQLLAFARRQPLAPKLSQIAELLDGAARLFGRTLGGRIVVEVRLDNDLWPVMIDTVQLESAVLNLSANARDAMPNGGTLVIEARNVTVDETLAELDLEAAPGDYVVISVSDTGIGMPPDVASKAFDPFFTTKAKGGAGLGLSMVHGFVRQSGGYTRIYTELGHGTAIQLYIPRARDGAFLADGAASRIATGKGELILVVEDDEVVREVAIRRLKEIGYCTIAAADAAEALTIIASGVPLDLLFTDLVLPGSLDGHGLAEEAQRLIPTLKVLFTSGFTPAAAAAAMPKMLGRSLLTKPYRREDLACQIRKALDGA